MQCDILVVPHETVWIFYICLMLENVINFTIIQCIHVVLFSIG